MPKYFPRRARAMTREKNMIIFSEHEEAFVSIRGIRRRTKHNSVFTRSTVDIRFFALFENITIGARTL